MEIINNKLIKIILTAFFITIMFILGLTSFGFIPIGILKITLLHVPVIISTIILGKNHGIIVGFFFGLMSLINNTLYPTLTSFIFSPFFNLDKGLLEILKSLIICFIPRIFIAISVDFIYKYFINKINNQKILLVITSVVGTITNTVLVIIFIYLFFWEKYISTFKISNYILPKLLIYSIIINCVFEIIISIIFVVTTMNIIKKYFLRKDF